MQIWLSKLLCDGYRHPAGQRQAPSYNSQRCKKNIQAQEEYITNRIAHEKTQVWVTC